MPDLCQIGSMALDVVDLRSFYATPLGQVARRRLSHIVRERWGHCVGLSVVGIGYATPFLDMLHDEAMRTMAFMPPVHWAEALYMPPFARRYLLAAEPAFEALGSRLGLPGAGLHLVEATKQLYRPVAVRRVRRRLPKLEPALAPSPVPPMTTRDY